MPNLDWSTEPRPHSGPATVDKAPDTHHGAHSRRDDEVEVSADGEIPVISLSPEDIQRLLGGDDSPKKSEPLILAPASRVLEAIEAHRSLFVDFTKNELETSENCLVAAAVVLFQKGFQDVLNRGDVDQIVKVMDLATQIASVLPDEVTDRAASKSSTLDKSSKGYL